MIKYIIIMMFFSYPVLSEEDSYQKYTNEINAARAKIDYSETLIKHDELYKIISQYKEINNDTNKNYKSLQGIKNKEYKLDKDGSDNNIKNGSHKDNVIKNGASKNISTGVKLVGKKVNSNSKNKSVVKNNTKKSIKVNGKKIYMPSELRNSNFNLISTSNKIQINIPKSKKIIFGITKGTRIKVKLDNSATNIQPGQVKFTTEVDIVGYKKLLPRNTIVFGTPDAQLGSERLFVTITDALVRQNHREFNLKGFILDDKNNPGLIAHVISDGKTLKRVKSVGINALGTGLIGLLPVGLGTGAGKSAASKLLSENALEDSARDGEPLYIIEANSQYATIEISETF